MREAKNPPPAIRRENRNSPFSPGLMPPFRSFRPLYLAGPTSSGKTALALALSRHLPVEIVNADAFQLYRGLTTLTAAPSIPERNVCPHHLYGILDPSETCDAGRYQELATPLLAEISARGRIPLVTGGSGLYLKALTHGLDPILAIDPALRATLSSLSLEEIRDRLEQVDPDSRRRIDPQNRRYLQRALEISLSSGRPASGLRQAWASDPPGLRGILLERPREDLDRRIDERVASMLLHGEAQAEVAAISTWSSTSLPTIGVREIQSLLRGEIDPGQCLASIRQTTRRYARRQMTWFRRENWMLRVAPPPEENWQDSLPALLRLIDGEHGVEPGG